MDTSEIGPATIAAYRAAHYSVLAPGPFVLLVGVVSIGLADLMAAEKASCAAFITAWNPLGEVATKANNSRAQTALLNDLTLMELTIISGFGRDPSGLWPGEESFLVLGLSLKQASDLGTKYGQNAIIWIGLDACPTLVLLR